MGRPATALRAVAIALAIAASASAVAAQLTFSPFPVTPGFEVEGLTCKNENNAIAGPFVTPTSEFPAFCNGAPCPAVCGGTPLPLPTGALLAQSQPFTCGGREVPRVVGRERERERERERAVVVCRLQLLAISIRERSRFFMLLLLLLLRLLASLKETSLMCVAQDLSTASSPRRSSPPTVSLRRRL